MQEEIVFEQMRLGDRGEILRFLRLAFPDNPRQSDEKFWNWHFLANPNTPEGEIPVWLARSSGRIVGQLATIPVRLHVGRQTFPAAWILDLLVDPQFRRRGIMKNLVREANRKFAYLLGSATPRQHSAAMLTKLGWTVFSQMPRYHRLLFPGNAVKEISRHRPVRAVVNAAFSRSRSRYRSGMISENIRSIETVDENFDALWQACHEQWPCSIARTADFLRWQFEQQPYKKYELLGYFENDQLFGYAVMFFRSHSSSGIIEKAAISDICYHPVSSREIVDALVAACIDRAIRRRVGGLVTDALDPLLQERLSSHGFWRVKSDIEIMAVGPEHQELLYDPNSWHLTRGDSDISIFEQPNL